MNRRQFLIAMFANGLSSTGIYSDIDVFYPQNHVNNRAYKIDSMCIIGSWYLKYHPTENNKNILIHALQKTIANRIDSVQTINDISIAKLLSMACTEDLEKGNIVYIDGWQLAITEARLCGLRSLEVLG